MWQTVGHDRVRQYLARAIAQQSLSHAVLFAGPQSIGKRTLALDLAAALLCDAERGDPCWECRQCAAVQRRQHPDLHLVEIEEGRKTIRMDQVAALQRAIALRPYQASQRVSLIFDAHLLQPEAGQRLLKTLEEPPDHNTLALTTTSTSLLPQTLVSRCQAWRLTALPISLVRSVLGERGVPAREAAFLAAASLGRLGWALQASTEPELREQEEAMVSALIDMLQTDRAARIAAVERLLDDVSDHERLFELWSEWWRALLFQQLGVTDSAGEDTHVLGGELSFDISPQEIVRALQRIEETREWVRANVNARLALETLVLHLPEAS